MKTIDVTLNEQQVSLVLGMIWHCRQNGTFDDSEALLVSVTENLFEDLENEMFNSQE